MVAGDASWLGDAVPYLFRALADTLLHERARRSADLITPRRPVDRLSGLRTDALERTKPGLKNRSDHARAGGTWSIE